MSVCNWGPYCEVAAWLVVVSLGLNARGPWLCVVASLSFQNVTVSFLGVVVEGWDVLAGVNRVVMIGW